MLFFTFFVFLRIAFLNKMQPLGKTYVPTTVSSFHFMHLGLHASLLGFHVSLFPIYAFFAVCIFYIETYGTR
jgi:hypothetical protein